MRDLAIAAWAVLLTAGAALGFGTATVLGPAEVDPGEVFEIEVYLQADEPMISFQFDGIMATGGATPGPTGTKAYHYGNDCGWKIPDLMEAQIWVPPPTAFPVGPMGTVAESGEASNGVCFRMRVVAPSAPYSFFDIYVTSGFYGSIEIFDEVALTPVAPLSVHVTPEPVSALLLLAGLAMSRRKRRS